MHKEVVCINSSLTQHTRPTRLLAASIVVQAISTEGIEHTGTIGLPLRQTGYVLETLPGPRTLGASVHLPGLPSSSGTLVQGPLNGGVQAPGYTKVHATYASIREKLAKQAYSTHGGEVVTVEVRVIIKPAGHIKMEMVSICQIISPVD